MNLCFHFVDRSVTTVQTIIGSCQLVYKSIQIRCVVPALKQKGTKTPIPLKIPIKLHTFFFFTFWSYRTPTPPSHPKNCNPFCRGSMNISRTAQYGKNMGNIKQDTQYQGSYSALSFSRRCPHTKNLSRSNLNNNNFSKTNTSH